MQTTIAEYLDALRAMGRSAETCSQYRWQLAKWSAWCVAANAPTLADLTKALLRRWAANLRDRYAPATCRIAVVAVKGFLRWCAEEELCPASLAACLKTPTRPKRQQRTATLAEVRRLLAVCGTDLAGVRNRALVSLAFDSLLRSGEICRLNVADINLDQHTAKVLGKGDKQEIVRFGAETKTALAAWLAIRPAASTSLFVAVGGTHPGRRLTRDGLRVILRKLADQAGVAPLSPHALRRGGAVALLENGAPSRLVQIHGRWDDLAMVEIYTQKLEAARLFDRYAALDVDR